MLSGIEERLTKLVDGLFARGSRAQVQPVELARRLVQEMEAHQAATLRQVFVPDRYDVYLAPSDHDRYGAAIPELARELGEFVYANVRRAGYAVASRPSVAIHTDGDLDPGSFGIASHTSQSTPDADAAANAQPAVAATSVFRAVEAVPEPAAVDHHTPLQLVSPTGTTPLTSTPIGIGRGKANGLVLADSSVSREHARIEPAAGGGWQIVDLASTNGVLANGSKVQLHTLAAGDVLTLGNVELQVTAPLPTTDTTGAR